MLFMIMGMLVLIALSVIGFLFYLLNKEGKKETVDELPIVNLTDFKSNIPPQPSVAEQAYQKRSLELEEELHQVSDKAVAQAQEALTMIDQLKRYNEEIEAQKQAIVAEYETKVADAGNHLTQLRGENNSLQVQLENSRVKLTTLEDELVAIKNQMAIEINRANTQLEQITKEKEEAITEGVNFQIAAMKADHEVLLQANLDLQETNQKLKELNSSLIEKNDILQYEMIKNRAQASGLERMCQNYKVQIEELLNKDATGRGVVSLLKN